MAAKMPTDVAKAATTILALCRDEESLAGFDPAELAVALRAASEICNNVAIHNLAMINVANIMKGGPK